MNTTCLGRAPHTAHLRGGGQALPPSHSHMYLSYIYPSHPHVPTRASPVPIHNISTHSPPACISPPWRSAQLLYAYLEIYVNTGRMILLSVICYSISNYFTLFTLYMFTFFRGDQVNHPQGVVEIYVDPTAFLTSGRFTTCRPTPIAHPEAAQPTLQLHSTPPRKALFTPSLVNGTYPGCALHTARPHAGGPAESHFPAVENFASLCRPHLKTLPKIYP